MEENFSKPTRSEEEVSAEGENQDEDKMTPAATGESSSAGPSASSAVVSSKKTKKAVLPAILKISHPLKHTWVLWHLCNDRSNKTWDAGLTRICSFDSVETFWALFNNISPPSGLSPASDYNVFREGIQPTWEAHKGGGRWQILVTDELDVCWLELLLAVIGEQFGDYSDEICGAVVSKRNKGDKVSVWTRDQNQTTGNTHIRDVLQKKLSAQISANRLRFAEYEKFW